MAGSQDSMLSNLADIVAKILDRVDHHELKNNRNQTETNLEVQRINKRLEQLENQVAKGRKETRIGWEEYDTSVECLGNLVEDVAARVAKAVERFQHQARADMQKLYAHMGKALTRQSLALSQKIQSASASGAEMCRKNSKDIEVESDTASTAESSDSVDRQRCGDATCQMNVPLAGRIAEAAQLEAKVDRLQVKLRGLEWCIHSAELNLGRQLPTCRRHAGEVTLPKDLRNKVEGIRASVHHRLRNFPWESHKPCCTTKPIHLPLYPVGYTENLKMKRQTKIESGKQTTATGENCPGVPPNKAHDYESVQISEQNGRSQLTAA
eukprot:Skav228566  [mRNA]  locus=scaffold5133:16029:17000:- [translate_table: standard]